MNTPEMRRRNWLRKRLNTLLAQAGYADYKLGYLQSQVDEEIAKVLARYAPEVDKFTQQRDAAVDKIQVIVSDDEQWKLVMESERGKTLKLRSGAISRRVTTSVEIDDHVSALAWLRKHRKLRAYTTQAEPSLSKSKLSKARELVRKLPGVRIVDGENMLVKPTYTQKELKRDLHPLRRPL